MPVKIMYLVDHYVGPQAGTEGQLLQLVQNLDRSRYEPSMTLLRSSEYIKRNPFPCPVRVLGITRLASIQTIFRIVRFALTLRRSNYRLVHCFFNDSSLIAPPLLKLFRIRVLVSRRDMGFWYTPQNLAVLRVAGLFVDRYVVNSNAVKKLVLQREWVRDEKVSVIYNGYDSSATKSSQTLAVAKIPEIPDGAPVVGIVANLRPIKRLDTLVEAFCIVHHCYPDARLVIVGDTTSREGGNTWVGLNALASRLGILERVIFTGRIQEPMLYINRFTVAVICSESEGFSNSIIEYMGAGRPIVCTNTGGNPELIQDGCNGFLVPVGDVDILADRLIQLLSDNALARRLGEAAYETVHSYSCGRMAMEHIACYDELLSADRAI